MLNSLQSQTMTLGILLANHDGLAHVRRVVENTDFGHVVVFDTEQLIQACLQHKVHLVVLDYERRAVCVELRQRYGLVDLPILMLVMTREQIDDALDLGATDVFLLPIHEALFLRRLRYVAQFASINERYTTLSGRFDTIYENAPVMMHSIGRNGRILGVNKRWLEVMGYERNAIIGTLYTELLHPKTLEQSQKVSADFWESGTVRNFHSQIRASNGYYVDVMVDSNAAIDPVWGQVAVSILHDITAQKRMEETLERSKFQTNLIFRSLLDVILIIDYEGVYVDVPSIGNTNIDLPLSAYLGRSIHQLNDSKRADFLLAQVRQVLESGQSRTIEHDLVMPTGIRWYNTVISPLNDRQVVAVARDISESRQKDEAIRESDRLYQNLFESATDAILLVSMTDGKIMEANESAMLMLGYTKDELVGMKINAVEVYSSENDSATATLTVVTNDRALFEQSYRHKDGRLIPVECHSRVIRYQNKAALLYFTRDITHRKRMMQSEQELRILAETLYDTASQLNKAVTLTEVLDAIIMNVRRIIPTPCANVMMIHGDRVRLERSIGYDAFDFPDESIQQVEVTLSSRSHFLHMLRTQKPLVVNDIRAGNWALDDVITGHWLRSYMGAPIILDGQVVGFLNLDSPELNTFSQSQTGYLESFTNQATIAIKNARLFEDLQDANRKLEDRVSERTDALMKANMSLRRVVSELREIEESLDKERSLLKMIIDSIPDMLYVKDLNGRYILINQATVAALGATNATDVLGHNVYQHFSKEYSDLHTAIDHQIFETGTPVVNMDNTMTYANGEVHRQLLTKYPLFDKRGKTMGLVGINRDITHLKSIEQNLREEREQLAQVLMSARCLLWSALVTMNGDDLVWDMQIINEAAAQALLPLNTTSEPYTEAWQKCILAEDAERRQYILLTHLQFNRRSFRHEIRCQQHNGNILWLAEEVEIREMSPNTWRLVGICTDITERKQAERNLQAAYEELELRIQLRTVELTAANKSLREEVLERERAEADQRKQRILAEALNQSVAHLNSTFELDAMFDYLLDTIEQIVPHQASNILLMDDADSTYATVVRRRGYPKWVTTAHHHIANYPDKQYILQHRTAFIIKDTRTFEGWANFPDLEWIRSSLSVPITIDDSVIGFLNVDSEHPNHFTDEHAEWLMAFANQAALAIRNARLIQQIRNHASDLEKQVATRTAELRAILASIRDGIIFETMGRDIQYVNPALERLLGYPSENWINGGLDHADWIVHDDCDAFLAKSDRALDAKGFWVEEVQLRRISGELFAATLMRVAVVNDDNSRIGTVTLVRDISQEKELQSQRERFIANASHELRTPIANMKTRLYLLKRKPENFEENLEIIVKVTNWMQRLVDDMFDISRFQRGTMELQRELVPIKELIHDLMMYQQPEAERKDIIFTLKTPPQSLNVYLDPYRFMQVISNLVGNAINYTPDGGEVKVIVFTELVEAVEYLVVIVQDNGNGIPAEHVDNLFKPFYRLSEDNRGAGLGLSIANEIVQLHGGRIRVLSEVGVGSQFVVLIPMTPPTPSSETGEASDGTL